MTADGKWILAIDYSGKALTYKQNETTGLFSIFQEIILTNLTSEFSYGGAISDDHEWIMVSINNQIKIYNYNYSKS